MNQTPFVTLILEGLSLLALAAKHTFFGLVLLVWLAPFWLHGQSMVPPGFPQLPQKKVATSAITNSPTEADDEFDYDNEFTYGVNFNTAGGLIGGGALKYAWRDGNNRFYSRVQLEIVHIKHPKETRNSSDISSYIPEKINYLFAIRPSYGKERTLFRKGAEEGVQLNAFAAVGPSLGMVKPYYVLYTPVNQDPSSVLSLPYSPSTMDPNRIRGVGGLGDGFDQLSVVPGAHIKGGLSFEFGRFRNSVIGIEVGFVCEVYSKSIQLLQVRPNPGTSDYAPIQNVNSLYLTLYYGKKN